ncbi:MAG TPA: hypothetical protein VGS41_09240 [Chthonomonadales bacterium]|nr:hypothetical protein [Chthonomonadales bacterium]
MINREFLVERQGKAFVLYSGLLDIAHQQGLKSISTQLIQAPDEANHRVAICSAVVSIVRDGEERTFTGLGDASPQNVASAMQNCLIRMAETRAKARALRDAVNVAATAFEELAEEDARDSGDAWVSAGAAPESPRTERASSRSARADAAAAKKTPPPAAPASPTSEAQGAGPYITEPQREAIKTLCKRAGTDPDTAACEKFGVAAIGGLSQQQASELIRALNERTSRRTPVANAA